MFVVVSYNHFMFLDKAEIEVQSGKGGDGVVHFRREKYVPRGGPDGGDGGEGGDVVIQVSPSMNTLYAFQHKRTYIAKNGGNGAKQNMTGGSADDLIIYVPLGTVIYDTTSGGLIADLVDVNQRIIVAKGGRGGRGNSHFSSSTRQVPSVAEKGEPGQYKKLLLELKLIADIGIIGVPNAGKSTLLASLTNAKPKIDAYPFTTLEPNLGVTKLDEDKTFVLADIPGLIEGAHQGIGLGHEFLRHIQRTRVLIHLLDGLSENPALDFAQINSELALFDPNLARKPQVVAINKIDIDDVKKRLPELKEELNQLIQRQEFILDNEPMAISAATGLNVRELIYKAVVLLESLPPASAEIATPIYRIEEDPNIFNISRDSAGWHVKGKAIERAAQMTYWEHYQSIRRFQRILETIGVDKALRDAGVKNGDTVFIGKHELEWQE